MCHLFFFLCVHNSDGQITQDCLDYTATRQCHFCAVIQTFKEKKQFDGSIKDMMLKITPKNAFCLAQGCWCVRVQAGTTRHTQRTVGLARGDLPGARSVRDVDEGTERYSTPAGGR